MPAKLPRTRAHIYIRYLTINSTLLSTNISIEYFLKQCKFPLYSG